jgi:hypothetical protein
MEERPQDPSGRVPALAGLRTSSDKAVEERLDRLEQKLDRIEGALSELTDLLSAAPAAIATVTDIADEMAGPLDLDARVRGAGHLLERLTEPATLGALERVLATVDALAPLAEAAAQAPQALATLTDIVDGWSRDSGVDLDARLRGATQLLEQLTEPTAMEALGNAVHLATEAPRALATVTDIVDEWNRNDPGAALDARVRGVARLLHRLTDPQALSMLNQMLDQAEKAPAAVAAAVDAFDDVVAAAAEQGIHVEELLRLARDFVHGLGRIATAPEVAALLESGIFGPQAIDTVSRAAQALVDARGTRPEPLGIFALLKASSDTDVQRALGFGVAFARAFGGSVATAPPPRQLTHG